MSDNILYTPSDILSDINLELESELTITSSIEDDGFIIKEISFLGRDISGERPRGYGMVCFSASKEKAPLILIFGNSRKAMDITLLKYYASEGYIAVMIDYAGTDGKNSQCTIYPNSVEYANLSKSGRKLSYVDTNARETSGFEWITLAIYAINATQKLPEVDLDFGIGVMGIGLGANIGWMLAALDKRVTALCSVFSAGWYEYCGTFKYGNETRNIEFDEERVRWIAGMSIQAYSKFIEIPVMFLSGSNNKFTEMDRSYDTMSRVSETCDKYLYFAPSMTNIVGKEGGENSKIFFNKHLKTESVKECCNAIVAINTSEEDGISLSLKNLDNDIESLNIYVCEGEINPSARYWKQLDNLPEIIENEINIKFIPKTGCKLLFMFANVKYKNGLTLSTNLAVKDIEKFNINFNKPVRRSPVIFNSSFHQNCFGSAIPENPSYSQILLDDYKVFKKEGAGKINGIGVNRGGIATYKIGSTIFKGEDEEILKFDIYCPVATEVMVYFLDKAGTLEEHYHKYKINIFGGEMWQPIEIKKQNLKTDDGQPLKSWKDTSQICFYPAENILINNMLWI